jgi:molybdopterin converting factor subunit 1
VTIRVWLFARYREMAGVTAVDLEIPPGTSLQTLWEIVQRRLPLLSEERHPLMAINQAYARPEEIVTAGSEVAYFPPVSGG